MMPIKLTSEKKGELFILCESLLWSLFPVITILSFKSVFPLLSLAWSTLFAAIFFGLVLSFKKSWHQLQDRSAIKDILLTTFLLGIVYYFLFFTGLRYTNAGNASLIALTEILFSFIFFNLWHKEHFSIEHMAGAFLMLLGVLLLSHNQQTFSLKSGILSAWKKIELKKLVAIFRRSG
jgi:drug/metabolite transporter (DMT)-like permease